MVVGDGVWYIFCHQRPLVKNGTSSRAMSLITHSNNTGSAIVFPNRHWYFPWHITVKTFILRLLVLWMFQIALIHHRTAKNDAIEMDSNFINFSLRRWRHFTMSFILALLWWNCGAVFNLRCSGGYRFRSRIIPSDTKWVWFQNQPGLPFQSGRYRNSPSYCQPGSERERVTQNLSSLCHRKGSSPAAERVSTINCHREGRNPLHREPSPFTTSLRRLGTRRKHLAQGWSFNKSFAPYPAIRAQHGGCSPINHCVFQKKFLRQ